VDAWIGLCEEEAERLNTPHGPLNPFAATGASSMYAWLGDGDKALFYLNYLLASERVAPTTLYSEGNPCIESPLSLITCVHDMMLQSHGGKIRVFPAAPSSWPDAAFHDLGAEGGFLVSARKTDGVTQFVQIQSLAGAPCVIRADIPAPIISINGMRVESSQVTHSASGFYDLALKKGDIATLTPLALEKAELRIEAKSVAEKDRHLFGFNDKTMRLTGHNYYQKKTSE